MKIVLDKRLVSSLTFAEEPIIQDGRVVSFRPNSKANYIVLDAHRDAPTGFGIRVSRTVKTYVIRRRVEGKVKTVVVGHHPSLLLGSGVSPEQNARLIAAKIGLRLTQGEDVNSTRKSAKRNGEALTLEDLFNNYVLDYKQGSKRRVRENTLLAISKAKQRLGQDILSMQANKITWKELDKFFSKKAGQDGHITAAEQTIRWVSAVYNHANKLIALDAVQGGIEPALLKNPARIFAMTNKMRTRSEIERDISLRRRRNPISKSSDSFRSWLNYVLEARRKDSSRTGADYLLTVLLLGARKMEVATLKWAERMGNVPAAGSAENYVDLSNGMIYLNVTKNGHPLAIPLPDNLKSLLAERKSLDSSSPWVFQAVSKSKLRVSQHYNDARSFIDSVRKNTGVHFTIHDLRRTFANVVNDMSLPSLLVKQLLNHKSGDVTEVYTELGPEQLRVHMQKIERKILGFSSTGYVNLKVID